MTFHPSCDIVILTGLVVKKKKGDAGKKKLVLKCDQESSVNAVLVRVAQRREGETSIEHSPVKPSGSNGIIGVLRMSKDRSDH